MNKSERMACNSHLLRTFVAVADCGNLTRAAEVLDRTQSAISVQAKTLEEILDAELFVRQSKGMMLTSEGEKLLPVARKIVSELTRVGMMFEDSLKGSIRVGFPDDYAEKILETVLVQFAERHPKVEVTAQFGCTSRFVDAIKENRLDVAIAFDPSGSAECRIGSDSNVWCASSKLRINHNEIVPLAILDRDCSWRTFATDALSNAGRDWRISCASENFMGVKSAIRSGLAVSALPRQLKDSTMIELGEDEGFPALPPTERGIISSDNAPQNLVQAMTSAIQSATRSLGQ